MQKLILFGGVIAIVFGLAPTVPTADNYVWQGVTTLIEGPDGGSPVPLAPFFARPEALPKSGSRPGHFCEATSIRGGLFFGGR